MNTTNPIKLIEVHNGNADDAKLFEQSYKTNPEQKLIKYSVALQFQSNPINEMTIPAWVLTGETSYSLFKNMEEIGLNLTSRRKNIRE